MPAFNKVNSFSEALAEKIHNLGADQLTLALTTNANAPVATDTVIADLTQISYTFCSSRDITLNTSAQVGGVYTLSLVDMTLTASGGSVGPFQHVAIYNSTQTTPLGPLIGWFDYGSEITLNDGESIDIDFASDGGPNGALLTVT